MKLMLEPHPATGMVGPRNLSLTTEKPAFYNIIGTLAYTSPVPTKLRRGFAIILDTVIMRSASRGAMNGSATILLMRSIVLDVVWSWDVR